MISKKRFYFLMCLFFVSLLSIAGAAEAYACAACFGRVDSASGAGLRMGILSLLVILLCVLGCLVSFFLQVRKRERISGSATLANDKPEFVR